MDTNATFQILLQAVQANQAAIAAQGQALLVQHSNKNVMEVLQMVLTFLTPLMLAVVLYVNKLASLKRDISSEKQDKKMDEQTQTLNKTAEVVKQVHIDGNSAKDALNKELKDLREQVVQLTKNKATADEKVIHQSLLLSSPKLTNAQFQEALNYFKANFVPPEHKEPEQSG